MTKQLVGRRTRVRKKLSRELVRSDLVQLLKSVYEDGQHADRFRNTAANL